MLNLAWQIKSLPDCYNVWFFMYNLWKNFHKCYTKCPATDVGSLLTLSLSLNKNSTNKNFIKPYMVM